MNTWQLQDSERIIIGNESLINRKHLLVGITRVRNESLILSDTLDYVGKYVDAIVAYDDASTDQTLELLRTCPKVALILANQAWEKDVAARLAAESRHRGLLLQAVREQLQFQWTFCFDADERVTEDLRTFTEQIAESECDGVRVQLFDAYMTPEDNAPYHAGDQLLNFRRFFGPEERDILMLWRNRSEVFFGGVHAREPGGIERISTELYCQHYGKSLSVDHWEETCNYYIRHFPFETYGRKWQDRKGRAIHMQSDFMRPLYEWGTTLFENAVKI